MKKEYQQDHLVKEENIKNHQLNQKNLKKTQKHDAKDYKKVHNNNNNNNHKKQSKHLDKQHKKDLEILTKENQSLKTKNFNLEIENLNLKQEINQQNRQFTEKAKTFASKAQEELQKFKKENADKLATEISENRKYGNQKFFENFLLLFGNLELAVKAGLKQENPAVNNYVRGFEMLVNQIDNLMHEFGLEKILPKVAEEYLPEFHQAFEVVENKKFLTNKIVEVKSNGYKLYDRVIKPAVVIVAK